MNSPCEILELFHGDYLSLSETMTALEAAFEKENVKLRAEADAWHESQKANAENARDQQARAERAEDEIVSIGLALNGQREVNENLAKQLVSAIARAEAAEAKLRVWEGDLNLKPLSEQELVEIITQI